MNWRSLWPWLVGMLGAEVLSFFITPHPVINGAIALFLGLVLFALTIWRPSLGLAIIVAELLIGSKGALFKYGGDAVNNGGISIRLIFFAAFFLGWLAWALIHKTWKRWPSYTTGRWTYLFLALLVLFAVFQGFSDWLIGENKWIFADANAWGFWLLLLPVVDLVAHERERLIRFLKPAVVAGLIWLGIQSLVFLFLFSHQIVTIDSPFYLWIRRTGLGEVTRISDHAFRIFMQSQIYAVLAFVSVIASSFFCHCERPQGARQSPVVASLGRFGSMSSMSSRNDGWRLGLLALLTAEIFISLSRSFWLGLAAGCLVLGIFILPLLSKWFKQISFSRILHVTVRYSRLGWLIGNFFGVIVGLALVFCVLAFPFPGGGNRYAMVDMIDARVQSNESAVISRWQLLPIVWNKIKEAPILGSGFGSTVTYQSADPRIV
ncbi:MAG: O-antigen ligase family protein, partial [bacterium]|nr:O-antigen ligase family protein [bacterium]